MHKRLARITLVLFAGYAFAGCSSGVVETKPGADGSAPLPDVGPGTLRDVGRVVVTLPDSPTASETGVTSCGNGILEGTEACDDGNTTPSDGCTNDCKIEPGWSCLEPGVRCQPKCGDGLQTGGEACDDGNTNSGDGCLADCSQVEVGWS